MAPTKDTAAYMKDLMQVPAPGSPHGVPIPGSERTGRSAVYRHHKFRDGPLLTTFDPEIQSIHDLFEAAVRKFSNKRCLGTRNWDPVKQAWKDQYEWITYGQVAERRKNFGAGIVEIHRDIHSPDSKFGVGLWCQNRAEWQIAGKPLSRVLFLFPSTVDTSMVLRGHQDILFRGLPIIESFL